MSLLQKIKSLLLNPAVLVPVLSLIAPHVFADGFSTANTSLMKVSTGLHSLAAATITIAVMWVGYKVLWDGKTIRECWNILLGGILIAGAAEWAALSQP